MKKRAFWTFLFCYISYTAIYIARLNLSMAAPSMKAASLMSSAQIGVLGSVFSFVYAAGRLFNGAASDRIPPWVMVSTGLLAAGASNLAVSFFPPFAGIVLLWGVNAFAQSMIWGSMLCAISSLYEPEEARRKASIIGSSVAAGNIVGILLSSYVISRFGIQWAFAVPGILVIMLGGAGIALLKPVRLVTPEQGRHHAGMLELLQNREIRGMLLPAVFHGVMKDNVTLWMALFFAERYGIDLEKSTYFVLFIPVMGIIGRTLYPACFRLCGSREHTVARYAFWICACSAALLCAGGISPAAAMIALALIYAAVSAANTSFSSIFPLRFSKSGNIASVGGLIDFSIYVGAGLASFLYGILIDLYGYIPMFFSWAICSLLSVVILRGYERGAAHMTEGKAGQPQTRR